MKYYENPQSQVYGFDETDPTQVPLIEAAIKNNWLDVSDNYPLKPTKEQTIFLYEGAAQQNLDSTAQSWGYNSMNTAVTYANSTNLQFKADAEALIAWRDSYWTEAYTIEAGTLPSTAEAFVAMLPAAPTKPVV